MADKRYQTAIPGELRDAIASHAQSLIKGDSADAEKWVEGPGLEGYRAAVAPAAEMQPT